MVGITSPGRRRFLLATAALVLAPATFPPTATAATPVASRLEALEADLGGRLGVCALDTASGAVLAHRATERFPMCSTFKVLAVAAVLRRGDAEPGLLDRVIPYAARDLVTYSPITQKHLARGMTVAELCAAALRHSDNTAANLLLRLLGGPEALTAFARSLGDDHTRLDRWEPKLNSALPGDPRDTTTPLAMARDLERLSLGDALAPDQSQRLRQWMLGNTTGKKRIQNGVPATWRVADKTGSGAYGVANDIAVVWPPRGAPLVLAIYTARNDPRAKARQEIIAQAAGVVVDWWGQSR